jgi:hypothetical protein
MRILHDRLDVLFVSYVHDTGCGEFIEGEDIEVYLLRWFLFCFGDIGYEASGIGVKAGV